MRWAIALHLRLGKGAVMDIGLLVQVDNGFNDISVLRLDAGGVHHRTPAKEQDRSRLRREAGEVRFLDHRSFLRLPTRPIPYNIHRRLVSVNEVAADSVAVKEGLVLSQVKPLIMERR